MSVARVVGRNTLATAVARLSVLFVWFLATPRVLARLGPDAFGFWSILLVLGGSLIVLDLGLGIAAMRFVARLHAGGDDRAVRRLVVRAALLQATTALVLGLVLYLARDLVISLLNVPAEWAPDARRALVITLVAFVVASVANFLYASVQGLQRSAAALWVAVPAAVLLGAGVFWAMGQPRPLVALTAVQLGYAVFTLAGYGTALAVLLRGRSAPEGPAGARAAESVTLRELVSFGGWVQVNAIFGLIQANVDKILLGTLVALAPVATYELGARLTLAASLPALLFLGALLPAFSQAAARPDGPPAVAYYHAALAPHFALTVAICGALIALGPWLLAAWLGEPPADAPAILALLALTLLGNLLTGVSSTIARALGGIRIETMFAVLGTAFHVTLAIVGLRFLGTIGLVAGTALASLLAAAWFVHRVERWLGLDPPHAAWRAVGPLLLIGAVAVGAAFLAAHLVAPAPHGRGIATLCGLATGVLVYALAFGLALRLGAPSVWLHLFERGRRLVSTSPS